MRPEERQELLAGYALGTLSGTDAEEVEALVRSDSSAAAELSAYHEIVDLIALDVPLRRADPGLRDRVLSAARRGGRPRRRLPLWRSIAVAALTAAFVLSLGWALRLQNDLGDLEDETAALAAVVEADARRLEALVESERDATVNELRQQLETVTDDQGFIVEVTTDPDRWEGALSPSEAAHGATGRVVWSRSEQAGVLVLSGLPPLPLASSYQVWLDDGFELVPGPVFVPDASGDAEVLLRPEVPIDPVIIVVGVAPAEGSTTVGQPVVLSGLVDR